MTKRVEEAVNNKKNGCNCAQAVACAFCDYAGISEDEMKKITQGFAVGMGTMEGSCGAIAGAAVVLGMANDNPSSVFQITFQKCRMYDWYTYHLQTYLR